MLLVAAAAILLLLGLGLLVTPDTWLALVSGRVVAEDGLPGADTLTGWTLGRDWIDQQWLGQLALYGLWRAAGLVLVGLVHVAVVVGALAAALVAARRRGGAPRDTAIVGLLALLPVGLIAGNIRTQSFALALFVVVLWLLCDDSRAPSRRVFWCVPLLVLWANVHGSVLVGAGLAGLAGLLAVAAALRGRVPRATIGHGAALIATGMLAPLATPYGVSVLSYFRDLFSNAEIGKLAPEWMPTALEPVNVPFFLLGGLALVLVARDRARLTLFEQLVLAILLVGALTAERNVAWFALAALLLLPPLLTSQRPAPAGEPPSPLLAASVSVLALVGVLATALLAASRAERQVDSRFPPAALAAIADRAQRDPALRLFVHLRYADWLLFRRPSLAGRLPLDIRYELLSAEELRRFRRVRDQVGDWRRVIDRDGLVVLDRSEKPLDALPPTSDVLLREPGARRLYDGRDIAVILRTGRG